MSETSWPPDRFVLRTALCLSGLLLWAGHFGAIYGLVHTTCALGLASGGAVRLAILLLTAATLAAGALVWRIGKRAQPEAFYWPVTRLLLLLSAFGVVAETAGALVLPACPALR